MNPCNNGSYHGWLLKEPTYIKNKDGVVFQARFVLKVKRDYRNREGKYEYDYIPMRLSGESRMRLAERMNPGDSLAICGSVKTDRYESNGQYLFRNLCKCRQHFFFTKDIYIYRKRRRTNSCITI